MSVLNLLDQEKISIDTGPMQRGASGFSEIMGDAFDATNDNYLAISRSRMLDQEMEDNFQAYRQITGQELKPSLAANYVPPAKISFWESMLDNDPLRGQAIKDQRFSQEAEYEKKWINKAIDELKTRDPVKFANLKNEKEQITSAAKRANMSEQELADSMRRSTSGVSAFTASLVGGGAAMFTDPFNLGATIATAGFGGASLTAARAAGQSVARTFVNNVLIEAGVNAGIELAQQPIVSSWQNEIGNEYGFKDAAANVGLAALFGGGVSVIGQGAQLLASNVFNKLGHYAGFNSNERTAAKILEREAMNREANPFVVEKNLDEGRHVDSLNVTEQAVNEGRALRPDELPIKNEEFLAAISDPNFGKNAIERNQLNELQAFKEKVFVDPTLVKPISKADQEILSAFNDREKATQTQITALKSELTSAQKKLESFDKNRNTIFENNLRDSGYPVDVVTAYRQELEGYKAARIKERENINPGKSGKRLKQFDAETEMKLKEMRDQFDFVRKQNDEGKYNQISQGISKERQSLVNEVNAVQTKLKNLENTRQPKPEIAPKKLSPKEERTRQVLTEVMDNEAPKDLATQHQLLKQMDTPERAKAFEQDFKRLVEENPNMQVTLDDGTTMKLSEVADEFKTDEKFQREITNCALGGGAQ